MLIKRVFDFDVKDSNNVSIFIDIIRGLAIILVIIVHIRNSIEEYGGFSLLTENWQSIVITVLKAGASGVALFFAISGFLLDFLYYKNMGLKKFFVKRVARIFPAWFLWHMIALAVAYIGLKWWFEGPTFMYYVYGNVEPIYDLHSLLLFLTSLFFLGWVNFAVWNSYIPGGWSIQSEVQHYIIFPLINKTKTFNLLMALFVLQLLGVASGITLTNPIAAAFFGSPFWFIVGIIFSRMLRNYTVREKIITLPELTVLLSTFVLTFFISSLPSSQITSTIVLILSSIVALLIFKNKLLTRIITKIGKYSYGMYFNHFILVVPFGYLTAYLVKDVGLDFLLAPISVASFIIITFISYLIAKIMYETYEKKFIIKTNKMFDK